MFPKMLKIEFDLDLLTLWVAIILGLIAILYIFWDVNYFLRTVWIIGYGRLFQGKVGPEDMTTIYGICCTGDLDIMLRHMNNARFVRELDFARFHFYDKTGIYSAIMSGGGNILQSACNIRYRKTIPFLNAYKVTTKLVHWDEKALYLEQQFITLKDGFVRAIAFSKQGTIGVNVEEVMAKYLDKDTSYRPEAPAEFEHFLNCIDVSSKRLRKKED